jgi:hypothetical protein
MRRVLGRQAGMPQRLGRQVETPLPDGQRAAMRQARDLQVVARRLPVRRLRHSMPRLKRLDRRPSNTRRLRLLIRSKRLVSNDQGGCFGTLPFCFWAGQT